VALSGFYRNIKRRPSVIPLKIGCSGSPSVHTEFLSSSMIDSSIRTFVKAILQREEFETLEADGGNPALETVRALG
jgi:hypothetical protein